MQSEKYWTKFRVIGISKNGVFSHSAEQKSANYSHAKVPPKVNQIPKKGLQIPSRCTEIIIVLEHGIKYLLVN